MSGESEPKELIEAQPLSYSYWLGTFVIRGSVATRIIPDVLGFGLLSSLVVAGSQYLSRHYDINLSIPAGPFEVAGAVLGLLLVLRLNAGYDRWWEARKLWGGIVNQSRNLAIDALAYGPADHRWRAEFIKWAACFPHVIRRSLRGERDLPELKRLLSDSQIGQLMENEHLPDAVAKRISDLLSEAQAAGMNGFAFHQANTERSRLIDHLGGCERILKTPLARSGAIQVRQFIFILLASLPFTLLSDLDGSMLGDFMGSKETNRLYLIPMFTMLLAYMLLALDRIGMELQNPFDRYRIDFLPLDDICYTIEKNLLELLHDDETHQYEAPSVEEVKLPPDASSHIPHRNHFADIS